MRDFYDRRSLPPYLQAASVEPTSSAGAGAGAGEVIDRIASEGHLNEVSAGTAGEADAAAGSVMTRVRSFGRLRNAPPQPSPTPSASIAQEPRLPSTPPKIKPSWPLKDKMRTAGVGLVMCLNVGTDPPDVIKPNPCAKLQCWMDPLSVSRAKAKEQIGERLEAQYAHWQQQRTAIPLKYRRALDPTVEDVRALCLWLRRQARTDRILLHYNGHGVPRPTESGEIWVFDKNHTQYIPLSVTELRHWMGKPNIVILDCNSAGVLMPFLTAPLETNGGSTPEGTRPSTPIPPEIPFPPGRTSNMEDAASQWISDTIVLCPTSDKEWLPMHPEYPADIFTSCLTTPIQMALRWFVRRNPQSMGGLSPEAVDAVPGKATDRKTPLGELTWIFAAVTDSIAWNVLPRPLFQRLFRQDLLVAGMFRNFLLADRILRSLNCSPQSYPPLPPGVCDHPLWESWDLACETCLHGLMRDGILGNHVVAPVDDSATADGVESTDESPAGKVPVAKPVTTGPASSISSPFFSEQLSAFEIWLEFASIQKASPGHLDSPEPFESPEQLPIVLQVLLTPAYRVRALTLLRRFLDLGPWAVNLALSLGILPYVTKLLHSTEYKQNLMGIWAKILAFDPSCQQSVFREGGLPHFVSHLTWGLNPASIAHPVDPKEAAGQRTMAAFILAATCLDFPQGQTECIRLNLHGTCCAQLSSLEFGSAAERDPAFEAKVFIAESRVPPAFRTWLCLCLGNLVKDNNLVQEQAFAVGVHRRLFARLSDDSPDVSAAACYALGCMLGSDRQNSRSGSNQDLTSASMGTAQQHPSVSFTVGGGSVQPGLVPGRLMNPPNQSMGTGIPGRLQPTFTSGQPGAQNLQWHAQAPMGMMPPQGTQLPQGQLHGQPPGYNPNQGTGMGMVPTSFGARQMDGSYLGRPQATFMSPQFIQNAPETRQQPPSVFEDDSRLAYDLAVTGGLLEATEDASAMVRYEAVVSLSRAVEKYLPAFVAIAHKLTMNTESRTQDSQPSPDSEAETNGTKLGTSDIQPSAERLEGIQINEPIPMPRGVEDETVALFTKAWKILRYLQRQDPYPQVASAANLVVSFVHQHILRIKIEQGQAEEGHEMGSSSTGTLLPSRKSETFNRSPGVLSGDHDVNLTASSHSLGAPGIRSLLSSPSISNHGQLEPGRAGQDIALNKMSEGKDNPIRRISSEYGEASGWRQSSKGDSPVDRSKNDGKVATQGLQFNVDYDLPVSEFYEWKKDSFGEYDVDFSNANDQLVDPLSFEGAVKSYREQRNRKVHAASKKIADHFASLAPKPPQTKKKQLFNVDLFEEDEDAANAANLDSAKKKKELELKQSTCLKNPGADQSCLLRFHAYEDALLVCDGQDGISVWDSRTNAWASRFQNGHPKGSLMTSASWVNEMSNSLFLVGCDDGSVRVWDGLIEPNGEVSSKRPSLTAAFFAVPDMVAGGQSGLILEWQQYSGRLLAGGNSKSIRCWDLGAEKCVSIVETHSDACVTTISTAWEYDPDGSHGMGPDIIIVGHGDGCMKLFDIRANHPAVDTSMSKTAAGGRASRRPRLMNYDEHKCWIISACFTGYGGRHEVVSGSIDGEIKMWDLRLSSSLRTIMAQRRRMTAVSVHPRIPVLATGSNEQFIKVMTLDGDTLQVVKYHEALAGHRIGPVSCLEFHPRKLLLAAGGTDSIVSVYSPKNVS